MSSPDELPELEGIDASEEFRRYVAELRQTWVPTDERAPSLAENRETTTQTPMSTEPSTDCTDCESSMMTRRGMMKATGATAVAVAGIGAGAGNVAAVSGLNFDGPLHDPFIKAAVTVANHESDFEPLDFIGDDGERDSLESYGGVIAPREDSDTPHNPVTLEAANFDAEDYHSFPREETWDHDSDTSTEEEPVSALDATHWTVDESGTAGSMTVADKTSPADGPGLQISTSSQTSGDVALATFDSSFLDITSGEDRKLMQYVLDIDTLESGAVVTFRVRDEDGDVREATIDPSADPANTGVIAAATAQSLVYQARMGDLPQTNNGDGDFNNLQEFEIEVKEANADISLYAINLERESEWVFGEQEYLNSDSEVDTQDVTEPSGAFDITGLDTIGVPLDTAKISGVQYDVELRTSELPDDAVEYEWADPGAYDQDHRFRMVTNLEAVTAYDLDWTLTGLYDTVELPSTRFVEAGIATGQSEDVTLTDIDDEDVSLTDRTSTYADNSIDSEVELTTAIGAGDIQSVFLDVLYNNEEYNNATKQAVAAGAASTGGGFFSGIRGWILGIGGIVGSYLGYVRFWK